MSGEGNPPPIPLPKTGNSNCRQREKVVDAGQDDGGPNPIPDTDRLKDAGVEIHTVGAARYRTEVNEDLLCRMASLDEWGNPLYSFIDSFDALAVKFVEISNRLAIND